MIAFKSSIPEQNRSDYARPDGPGKWDVNRVFDSANRIGMGSHGTANSTSHKRARPSLYGVRALHI